VREVDQVLLGFPEQQPGVRRYLLRRLERTPFPIDPEPAHALLRGADSGETAGFARLAEEVFFERREEDRLVVRPRRPATATGIPPIDLIAAATGLLAPLLELATRAAEEAATRAAGLSLLGRLRLPASLERLRGLTSEPRDLAIACAVFGGEAPGEILAEALRHPGAAEDPVVVASLRACPSLPARELLAQATSTPSAREGAAVALEGFAAYDVEDLLRGLLDPGDPFPYLQALESLGRLGTDAARQHLREEMARAPQASLRAACLRASLGAEGPLDEELVARGLADASPQVQAIALEAAAERDPTDEIQTSAQDLLASPDPRVAALAARVVRTQAPDAARQRLVQLLGSGQAPAVLATLYVLGDLPGEGVRDLLRKVANRAGAGGVRLACLRALGRHLARGEVGPEVLLPVLRAGDPGSRRVAAWSLTACAPTDRARVAQAVGEVAGQERDPATRAVLAETLGLLGADQGAPALEAMLGEPPEVSVAAAAALASGLPETGAAAALEGASAPHLAAFSALRSWTLRGDGAGELATWAATGDAERLRWAMVAGRRMAEGARLAPHAPALAGLRQRLADSVDASSEELSALLERTGQLGGLASELGGLFMTREEAPLPDLGGGEDLVVATLSVEGGPAPLAGKALPTPAPTAAPTPSQSQLQSPLRGTTTTTPPPRRGIPPAALAAAALAIGLLLRLLLG
jgi:hypothetical protein